VVALPFGGHPTFLQYLTWAGSIGCTIKYGISTAGDGSPSRIVMIDSPDGSRWVVVADTPDAEYLVPTMIAYFDRRLGVTSPFFAIDADNPSSSY
jgi:hypothetical protein